MKSTVVVVCLILFWCGCSGSGSSPFVPPCYDVYVDGELVAGLATRRWWGGQYCTYTSPSGFVIDVFGPHIAVKHTWSDGEWSWEERGGRNIEEPPKYY